MKLIEGEIGRYYRVIEPDLPPAIGRRLEALGMTGGSRLQVINKKRRGAMVIKVRGTRFAIGESIARRITVREEAVDEQ